MSKESDLEKALFEALPEDLQPRRQLPIQLDGSCGQLGGVDLAVTLPGEQLVLMELKWGVQGGLAACAWDVLKLATAQVEGKTSRALLVAAASESTWARKSTVLSSSAMAIGYSNLTCDSTSGGSSSGGGM